jgi:putative ATP-binding cassette transporter
VDVIRTLYRESPEAWKRTLAVAGAAGVANAAILAIINRGASLASSDGGQLGLRLVVLFFLAMLGFYAGKRYALTQASVIVEDMVQRRLIRVCDRIRASELELVEHLGRGELYTKIAQDTSLISQSGLILVNAAQQAFVLIFCLVYIAWLSLPAFVATIATLAIGLVIYARHSEALAALFARLTVRQAEAVDALGHMVDGFKEVRLNQKKSDAVFDALSKISLALRDLKIEVQLATCVDIMFSDLVFYSLLSVIVFLLPRLVPTYGAVVLMTTAAVLFIIGPMQMVVQAAPVFQRATNALKNIDDLERRLAEGTRNAVDRRAPRPSYAGFQTVSLDSACFTYPTVAGATAFSVGPLTLQINRGETVFLVGGNGSGKTTILKVLAGLYMPQRGGVKVDHDLLDHQKIQSYRELFSTVFSDFHLFDRLYGLEGVDEARVHAVLREMELSEKTGYVDGRFTDLNLSTGQRKRLALAIGLLEDKDIMVFDEWAADQDPHFRKYFYDVVLKSLKDRGKTVIAATHDDRYWSVADRVIRLEYGAVVDELRTA